MENLEQLIAQIDVTSPSPSARAQAIYDILVEGLQARGFPGMPVWDVVCFCAEYLSHVASLGEALESEGSKLFTERVKAIIQSVYSTHYIGIGKETESIARTVQPAES